jgi:hypothetical protein
MNIIYDYLSNLFTTQHSVVSPTQVNVNIVDFSHQNPIAQIPHELISIIFRNLPATQFFKLGLVCKTWKKIVESKDIQNQIILPFNINGPQRWKEFTDGDVGEVPPLPIWVFKLMEKDGHMLTYIPESVKITNKDGTEKIVPMDSLKNIGDLFANTINGRSIGFSEQSWQPAIQEQRLSEKGHWVLISKNARGKLLTYQRQVARANEMEANLSDLIDTVISLLFEYLRTGNQYFIGHPPQKNDGQRIWVRVNDITHNRRLAVSFVSSGLDVRMENCNDEDANNFLAFAPARKFFGP